MVSLTHLGLPDTGLGLGSFLTSPSAFESLLLLSDLLDCPSSANRFGS